MCAFFIRKSFWQLFSSFALAKKALWYKKCARKMLMKLTPTKTSPVDREPNICGKTNLCVATEIDGRNKPDLKCDRNKLIRQKIGLQILYFNWLSKLLLDQAVHFY
jgi:hypothetical protein